jgi:hypothetical protein
MGERVVWRRVWLGLGPHRGFGYFFGHLHVELLELRFRYARFDQLPP